ncbi:protein kinase domain-containing protein [Gordonia iterans]
MSAAPGSMIAGYQVVSLIGSGGMGEVYLVENPQLGRREAMKVVSVSGASNREFAERFANEARTVASLDHPSIVTIFAYGIADDRPWFTMTHLSGPDLGKTRLTPAEAGQVLTQVGDALDYAHARGVVHRDIKPGNIVVTRHDDGRLDRAVLLDFGIAKLADSPQLTAANSVVGTMAFTAPEVIGGRAADGRSDQYSLACTVYKLLTGASPFPGDTSAAVMTAHLQQPVPSLAAAIPSLAPVAPVLQRAMAKDPAARYPDCRTFAAEFNRALAQTAAGTATTIAAVPGGAATPDSGSQSLSGASSSPGQSFPSGPASAPGTPAPFSQSQYGQPRYGPGQSGPHANPYSAPGQGASGFQAAPFGPGSFPPPAKKSRTKWFVLAAVVVLIAAVGGTAPLWWPSSAPPEEPGLAQPGMQLARSGGTTCAISEEKLYCWGSNHYGQLGNGTTSHNWSPGEVASLSGVTTVSLGGYETEDLQRFPVTACATAEGKVYCWGSNGSGQVGDGAESDRSAPFEVPDLHDATAVTTGWAATCAIARKGDDPERAVYCWGFGKDGTLGDGVSESRKQPVKVSLPGEPRTVATSTGTVCAVVDPGDLYCWGNNSAGQLGDGTRDRRATPQKVNGVKDVSEISLGLTIVTNSDDDTRSYRTTACAIAEEQVYCWGYRVGGGDSIDVPTQVSGISSPTVVSVDVTSACAVTADGDVYCWGNNNRGQIGNGQSGDDADVEAPTKVNGISGAISVVQGSSGACALQADGELFCWGVVSTVQDSEGETVPQRVLLG